MKIENIKKGYIEAGVVSIEDIEKICTLEKQYAEECEEIAEGCEEEGYHSHGSNYDLRCENIRKSYDEEIDFILKKYYTLNIALCQGRHDIPQAIDGSIYPMELNPLDIEGMKKTVTERLQNVNSVNLYVTGLTVALVEVIKYCNKNGIELTLYHYDRNQNTYYPQIVF